MRDAIKYANTIRCYILLEYGAPVRYAFRKAHVGLL